MFAIDKKKIGYMLIMMLLILSVMVGCKKEVEKNPADNETNTVDQNNNPDKNTEENQDDAENGLSEEELQEGTEQTLHVYYGDETGEKVVFHESTVDAITPEVVVEQLIENNVLNEDIKVVDFQKQEEDGVSLIHIDFSEAFQTQLFQTGTSGEWIMMASVVNTFLDAFDAEKIRITVDGVVLESGHAIYDDYLTFYALEE